MAKIIRISVLSLLASVSIGCGGGSPGAPVDEGSSSVTLNPVEPMTPGCENSVTLAADDPAFETDQCKLAEPLMCTPFENPDKEPVLLIHGTFTNGPEQYTSTYIPYLRDLGFDVCITTYPDRGFGDQQISAEYVVYAVLRIHQETGLKVDMAGHSQGASMPRWAIRWWPSVQNALDDFVMHAGPNHGTIIADQNGSNSQPPAFWQFQTGSNFVAAVNTVDETPGDIDYTSIYTTYDELVQPQPTLLTPNGESTSALDVI